MIPPMTTNKLIAAALTLALVFGLFAGAPLQAAAADGYDEANSSVTAGSANADSEKRSDETANQSTEPGDSDAPSGIPDGSETDPPAAEGEEPGDAVPADGEPADDGGGDSSITGTVPVIGEGGDLGALDIKPNDVCAIGTDGYTTLAAAIAAVPNYYIGGVPVAANKRTIKMLKDYREENDGIVVDNKHVTLDLNGKDVTIAAFHSYDNVGLYVCYNGSLLLKDPYNGSLNVSINSTPTDDNGIVGAWCSYGGKAEVSSVALTNARGYTIGVYAYGEGSELTVYGDVTKNSANNYGAYVSNGGKITVEGEINVPAGVIYSELFLSSRNKGDYDKYGSGVPRTAKAGYLQYSRDPNNPTAPDADTVWVKYREPVCEITHGYVTTQYASIEAAVFAAPYYYNSSGAAIPANARTIKILKSHDLDGLNLYGKHITLDLNGKKVNIVSDFMTGLSVLDGFLLLLDPYDGEFNVKNVTTYSDFSGGVSCSNGVAEVCSVAVMDVGDSSTGVSAVGTGSEVIVYGDVTISSAKGRGAWVYSGGKINVEGRINIPAGATYILAGTITKTQAGYDQAGGAPRTDKPGYFQYSVNPSNTSANTVWVRDPDARPVCKVVETGREYFDVQSAIDSAPNYYSGFDPVPANARTVKMLKNHNGGSLVVNDKAITLDLNGYTLSAHNPAGHGLSVQSSTAASRSLLLLKDPYNGQFNVSTGGSNAIDAGVYCNRGRAEVSNAEANVGASRGVLTGFIGDEIIVFRNVTVSGTSGVGAQAANGSSITVEGAINPSGGASYIMVVATTKAKNDLDRDLGIPVTDKPGYSQYTGGTLQARVWVHDLASAPVCEVVGQGLRYATVQDAIDVAPRYYVSGVPSSANRRTIKMLKSFDSGELLVDEKYITLDLNGFTLNAYGDWSHGLFVRYNGALLLKEPYNGRFNVSTGGGSGSYYGVYCASGGRAEVSNAALTNNSGSASGVYATGADSEITVYGDVAINSASGIGARAASGGRVTIGGELRVPGGAVYINNGADRAKDDYNKTGDAPRTAKPGYLQYSSNPTNPTGSGVSTVWVRDPNVLPVCEIVETGLKYFDVQSAINTMSDYIISGLTIPANARTIKMLKNYDSVGLVFNNKMITLDLNGYTLNMDGGIPSDGLWVQNNGSLLLKDPYNGHYNVLTSGYDNTIAGVYCTDVSKAEVSSAVASGSASGVYADGADSEIIVYGDVTISSYGYGAITKDGGKVTIEGELWIPVGATYIRCGTTDRTKGDSDKIGGVPTTAKPGYLQYSTNPTNPTATTANTVWVRDPAAAFTPVADICGVPEEMAAGAKLTLSGSVLPSFATGKTIVWSLQKAGTTGASLSGNALTAPNAGSLTIRATVANGIADMMAFTKDFDIEVKRTANLISVTPTHAILANMEDSAVFEAILASELDTSENYAKIVWSLAGKNGSPPANLKILSSGKGRSATVGVTGTLPAQTVTVKAVLDGKYTATATVEIMPAAGNATARLLDSKATVNKAKDIGALVPVLITRQAPGDFGLTAFALPGEPDAAGSVVISKVELFTQNTKTKAWDVPAAGYKARMYGFDDRYIAIDADGTAKNVTVWAKFTLEDGAVAIADPNTLNKLKLTVTTKYPKIALKAEGLNLAFPDKGAVLTATSGDGACTVVSATPAKAADKGKIIYGGGALSLGSAMKKTGTVSMSVAVKVAGYKTPYKTEPKVSVKVVNTLPNLKLSPSSVKLFSSSADRANIKLVSGNKTPFESGYAVKDVALARVDAKGKAVAVTDAHLDMHYSAGVVSVKPKEGCPTGKSALLKISFVNGAKDVYLPLSITLIKDPSQLTLSAKTKSGTVNAGNAAGTKIADIPIEISAANYALDNWKFTNVAAGSPLDRAIALAPGRNTVTLSVKNPSALSELLTASGGNMTHTLKIGSPSIIAADAAGTIKTVSFALTVTKKAGGVSSISIKSKIDIANPASAITATAKLANTSSDIESVKLLKGAAPASAASPDFYASGISGKTFRITAAHKQVVPNVAQKVYVHITLKDGQTLPGKLVTIKPAQTVGKAAQSKKAVTLYKLTPQSGETVGLGLKTPANVKLGGARLNQARLNGFKLVTGDKAIGTKITGTADRTDGFRLVQNGAGSWTVYFKEPIAPKALDKNNKVVKLKKSYTLKLELWAEGTYRLDASGKPVALQAYDAKKGKWVDKSKPTYVNVKVNIK